MSFSDDLNKRHDGFLKNAENRLKQTKRRKFRRGERQDPVERLKQRLERKHKGFSNA